MKCVQSGSCLIVILISMGIILAACAVLFQSSLFFKTLSSVRIKEAQAQVLVLGLMRYGITTVKDNYELLRSDDFAGQEAEINLTLEDDLRGTINIRPQEENITLVVSLEGAGMAARSGSCMLALCERDQKLLISSFQM
jgi:type II secretory pathway component PulK